MKIIKKGSYGYIDSKKVLTALQTLLFFAVSIGLYIMGYVTTGSNKNLLTIVAVLGCLPACKSAVNLIILLKAKECSKELHEKLKKYYDTALTSFYDLYFTSYQKNFPISHMVLKGNVLCGITENKKCDCNEAGKHLEQMLVQEGIKNLTVKIYSNEDKYFDRLSQLMDLKAEEHNNKNGIISLLYSISL